MYGCCYRLCRALVQIGMLASIGALGLTGCQTHSQVAQQEGALAAAGFQLGGMRPKAGGRKLRGRELVHATLLIELRFVVVPHLRPLLLFALFIGVVFGWRAE